MKKLTKTQVIAQAKKAGEDGILVKLYPSKANINSQWFSGYDVRVYYQDGQAVYINAHGLAPLDTLLDHFKHYNCTNITGRRIHYYLVEENQTTNQLKGDN